MQKHESDIKDDLITTVDPVQKNLSCRMQNDWNSSNAVYDVYKSESMRNRGLSVEYVMESSTSEHDLS